MRNKPPPPRPQPRVKRSRAIPILVGVIASLVLALSAFWLTRSLSHGPTSVQSERATDTSPQTNTSIGVPGPPSASGQPPTERGIEGSEGSLFACSVVKVHDGDGPVWCSEGERVRLAGIAARELDESCRPNQPCPPASGASAQSALERMVMGKVLSCRQVGTSYNRTVAWCRLPSSEDVSCEMIKTGTAVRWERYDPDRRLAGCSR